MGNKEAKDDLYAAIDSMKRYMGLTIPISKYPKLRFTGSGQINYIGSENVIELRDEDDLYNGSSLGEEIGHFFRETLLPERTNEVLTDEYFGFLGARVMYRIARQKKIDKELFPQGEPNYEKSFFGTKSDVVKRLGKIREEIFKTFEDYSRSKGKKKKELYRKGKELSEKREDILTHSRGYEFASHLDLDKVDYDELFSLPNDQVRMRFFRSNPKYKSGISLEGKVALLSLGSFILSLFFINEIILTGNAIGNEDYYFSAGFLFLFISMVCVILILFLSNRKAYNSNERRSPMKKIKRKTLLAKIRDGKLGFNELEEVKRDALENQDSDLYYRSFLAIGHDEDEIEDRILFENGRERYEQGQKIHNAIKNKKDVQHVKKRMAHEEEEQLAGFVAKEFNNGTNPNENTGIFVGLFRQYGIREFYDQGRKIPISSKMNSGERIAFEEYALDFIKDKGFVYDRREEKYIRKKK